MYGWKVGIGDFSKKAFEGRDAEGNPRRVKDRGIQLFEIIAAPLFPTASLPFDFDKPEALLDM